MPRRRVTNGSVAAAHTDGYKSVANRLRHRLADTERQLELNEQIVDQLDQICAISSTINGITNRLLYEIADMNDAELEDLKHKEAEAEVQLKKYEKRLQMLRQIATNGCRLDVEFMAYKRTPNETLIVDNKEVFIDGVDYEMRVIDGSDGGTEVVDDWSEHSDRSSQSSDDVKTVDTEDSLLNDISKRHTGRKRLIPERFESFPSKKSSKNGAAKKFIYFTVLAFVLFCTTFFLQ